jgi:uncharacterized protein (TIGR02996 family)
MAEGLAGGGVTAYAPEPGVATGCRCGMAKPTGDELALLKAVACNPHDDLPRLVYADWLEERGRAERAHFIRLQIEEHHCTAWSGREQRRTEMLGLLQEHGAAWFRELPRWVRQWYGDGHNRVEYRRGFVEEVSVIGSHFLRYGTQLLDRTPLVSLRLYELRWLQAELAACPWLGRVPRLNLAFEQLGTEGGAALARNRHLAGVKELDLYDCNLGDDGVRALADSDSLGGLQKIDLGSNDLTLAGVKALRGAQFLRTLVQVDLSHNRQLRGHEKRIRGWLDVHF